jgi:flagellar hook protein FlgE
MTLYIFIYTLQFVYDAYYFRRKLNNYMVVLGSVSGNALASLTAIDQWMSTLNSSTAGSARTGYKNAKITFGGGTTRIDKPVVGAALGIQYAEQALSVGSTNIDFSEGNVVASTEFTHTAITGSQNAFFVLVDKVTNSTTVGSPNSAADVGNGARFYLSRDGEFYRDRYGFLRSRDGLYVMGLDSANAQVALNISPNDPTPELTMSQMLEQHDLNTVPVAGEQRFSHAYATDLQALKYSKYGGTVFETANPLAAGLGAFSVANAQGITVSTAITGTGSQSVRIQGSSLEASNVQLPSTLVELSLAQKIYSALTKVIQTDQSKLDSILQLIR